MLSRERQGEIIIFADVALWSLFPVITILSLNSLPALVSLIGSTIFATLFFAFILSVRKKWAEIKNTAALKDILITTLLLGVIYYLLFFFGLRSTSAGNASILALSEVFFSFLFFRVLRKEYIPTKHILGAFFVVSGALIVLLPNIGRPTGGEFLILAASVIAPFGNFFQQRARKKVGSETIMFIRSLISSVVILIVIFILKPSFEYSDIKNSIAFLLINGVLLLGLAKILWVEGIHRISVTKANALASISPLFTLLFALIFLNNIPAIWQLLSFIPMFFGILLLGKKQAKNPEK